MEKITGIENIQDWYRICTSPEITQMITRLQNTRKIKTCPMQEKLLDIFLNVKKTETTEEIIDKVLTVQFTEEQKRDLIAKAENDSELKEQFEKMAEIARNFPMKN
jgi:hypothetical protein